MDNQNMDNRKKLATQVTQDEEKLSKNTTHTICVGYHYSKQTQIT